MRLGEAMWLAAAAALVPLYTNSFVAWQWLSETLSAPVAAWIPAITLAALVLAVAGRASRGGGEPRNWYAFLLALALAGAAFWMADEQFPAKRIHVAQYILLALVVRKAFDFRLSGIALLVAAGSLTTVLGVHDELLQGLHPDRFFGTDDLLVNTLSAWAGAALGHGLWRESGKPGLATAPFGGTGAAAITIVWPIFATALMITAMVHNGPALPPFWAVLPILSVVPCTVTLWPKLAPEGRLAVASLTVAAVLTLFVPLFAHVTQSDFR